MDNKEAILEALDEFSRKPSDAIPPVLEQYLQRIATTGETTFPWPKVKPVFIAKMDKSMKWFHEHVPTDHLPNCPNVENIKFEEMRTRLLAAVGQFNGAPFTIQRLCELVVNPEKHYKRTDKFLRGIEKNILVVSTVDAEGRKVVSESRVLANGLDSNGVNERTNVANTYTPEKLKPFTIPPAPTNSPITTSWSFSSVPSAPPVESEWRPQPMDSSSEAVSASPTELWEKSPDKSRVDTSPNLPQPYPTVSMVGTAPCLKPVDKSPSKDVSSSDDLVSDKPCDDSSPQVCGSSNAQSTDQKADTSSVPASSSALQESPAQSVQESTEQSTSDEPDRKRIKTGEVEENEADSRVGNPELVSEERRQSEGFDTPVSSSGESESSSKIHSNPAPPQDVSHENRGVSSMETPSSSDQSEPQASSGHISGPSTDTEEDNVPMVHGDCKVEDRSSSIISEMTNIVSSVGLDTVSSGVSTTGIQANDEVTSGSDKGTTDEPSKDSSSVTNVSSSGADNTSSHEESNKAEYITASSETTESRSDTSVLTDPPSNDKTESDADSQVSQSSEQEPMDTA